jgi:DNA-binding transcriptional LysR family regulator
MAWRLAGHILGGTRLATKKTVWLVAPKRKPLSPAARAFVDWMLKRMAADRQAHPATFEPLA